MQLNDYLQSPSFKKYLNSPNYAKIVKYIIFYDILFDETPKKIDELISRINDSNIEINYINIVSNKLLAKNDNKKKIYQNLLEKVGNLKYEINTSNESPYFEKVLSLFNKNNITINLRNKRVISNNMEKIISIYPLLDNNISSIADMVLGTNKALYSNKDYYRVRKSILDYLKEQSVSLLDTTLISYYLDRYYFASKSELVISNNVEVTKELLDNTYKQYKNDINSFLSFLLNDKKEKRVVNKEEELRIILPYEEDPKVLEGYLVIQEKIKTLQEEEIKRLSEKKGILEENIN